MSVSIGAVEGVLSSDATISDIVLSDRDGPWLKVDKVQADLEPARAAQPPARGRSTDDRAYAGPAPPPALETPAAGHRRPAQPILPELPLKVIVKDFAIQELSLGEPVVGVAARLDIAGQATLGPPSEGLDLSLTSRRLDAGGQFKALMTYVPRPTS